MRNGRTGGSRARRRRREVGLPHFIASDGARIVYDDAGGGRPVLLLHGLMANRAFFRFQAPLAAGFRLIGVDLRGHGESGRASPAIDRMAADVAELAEALEIEDAIGVGWSLGATVLWHVLGGGASGRFAGSVAVDMTPRVRNGDGWALGLSPDLVEARTRAIAADFPSFASAAGRAIFSRPAEMGDLPTWSGDQFARSDARAIAAAWASLAGDDLRPRLAAIRQPTLIVHGADSHLYDEETARYLAATIPRARAVRFDRSGHSPHMEEPDRFNRTLRDFAASLPPAHQRVEQTL